MISTMAEESFTMKQEIFRQPHAPIRVDVYHENTLTRPVVKGFLETIVDGVVGVAPAYGPACVLVAIALSSNSRVLLVHLSKLKKTDHKPQKQAQNKPTNERTLLQELLGHPNRKYAFKMDKLATSLYRDIGVHIHHGVDLLSNVKGERRSLGALMKTLGGETKLHKDQVSLLFKQEESASVNIHDIVMQAWAASQSAIHMSILLANAAEINTQLIKGTVSRICSLILSVSQYSSAPGCPYQDSSGCRTPYGSQTDEGEE